MILWINGAFGIGKSSVSEAIKRQIDKSLIYDPEQVGYFLWDVFPDEMKRKCDFQHIDVWREFNYKILKHISCNYTGVIIVPMTVYIKQYYDEILQALMNDGIMVKHYILSASKQTIINRLVQRGDAADGWQTQHIDTCIDAFETSVNGEKIDTESKSADEIAAHIIDLCNLAV